MADNVNIINLKVVEREFSADPLFNLIKRKNKLDQIFDNEYIMQLEKLTWYSTTSVAPMCNTHTSQIQYYVRNFLEYLEIEETPSTGNAFKIDYKGVIRLKMIFILKDEYRTKGLKQELGYDNVLKPAKPVNQPAELWLSQNKEQLEYLISFLNESGFVLIDEEKREVEVNPNILRTLNTVPRAIELISDTSALDSIIKLTKDKKKQLEASIEDKQLLRDVLIKTNGLAFRSKSPAIEEQKGFLSIFKKKTPVSNEEYDETQDPQIQLIDESINKLYEQIEEIDEEVIALEGTKNRMLHKVQSSIGIPSGENNTMSILGVDQNEPKRNDNK